MRFFVYALVAATVGLGGGAFAANAVNPEPDGAAGAPRQESTELSMSPGTDRLCTACLRNVSYTGGAQSTAGVGACLEGDADCQNQRAKETESQTRGGPTGI